MSVRCGVEVRERKREGVPQANVVRCWRHGTTAAEACACVFRAMRVSFRGVVRALSRFVMRES